MDKPSELLDGDDGGYVFDSGPDLLEAQILKNANDKFVAKYRASRARTLPLLDDLRRVGFKVNSPSDLVKAGPSAGAALGVLMKWFPTADSQGLQVDILKVLEQGWAYDITYEFLYRSFTDLGTDASPETQESQWSIGGALVSMAKQSDFEQLFEIASDRRYETGRGQLLFGIGRFKTRKSELVPVLHEALDATEIESGSAAHALGELRAIESRSRLEKLSDSTNDWIRAEARKALRKFATAEARASSR